MIGMHHGKQRDLLKFNPDEFREKQIKRLKTVRSSGILRTSWIDICERTYWNKGVGTQVLVAFVNYYIDHGINEIHTQTWSGNHRMVNLAKRIGFLECNCLENSILARGNTYDSLTFKLDIRRSYILWYYKFISFLRKKIKWNDDYV